MTTSIDCETLRRYRDEYLRGDVANELVDAHLAECPSCLEAFLDVTLARPTAIAPPLGFATRVVANLPPEPSSGARRVILVISALLGVAMAALAMTLGDTAVNLRQLTMPEGLSVEAAVVVECVLLFWVLSCRRGVLIER
jgi:predicted anti-sigma-YlaC factor YlaD